MRGHVILDTWPRELDWKLVISKIAELMSPYCILHWRSFFVSFSADFGTKTFVSSKYLAVVYCHNTYISLF